VLAEVHAPLPVVPERESVDVRWVSVADVLDLRLHDGFAEAWPLLLPRLPAA
jgi:8-oxo-dGTP diphosphatase